MDKIKINNQIISMRKYVKQAKVRIINKLVKQAKSLQLKHGNELQLQKYKRKADKILSEIEIIKKLNVDAVSKSALMKEKNWGEQLASKTANAEERAFALLANFEPVQSEVEVFHNKNPNLVPIIPVLIKQWEEKKAMCPEKPFKNVKASGMRLKNKGKKFKQRRVPSSKEKKFKKPDFPVDDRFTLQKTSESEEGSKESTDNARTHKTSVVDSDMDTSVVFNKSADDGESCHNILPPSSDGDTVNKSADSPTRTVKELSDKRLSDQNTHPSSAPKLNKQKVVTHLNLDELDGKDTIPINGASDPEEMDFQDSDDNKSLGQELKKDPFFVLGDEPLEEDPEQKVIASDSESSQENHPSHNRRNNHTSFRGRNNHTSFRGRNNSATFSRGRKSSPGFRGRTDDRGFRGRTDDRGFRGRSNSRSFRGRNSNSSFRDRNNSSSFSGSPEKLGRNQPSNDFSRNLRTRSSILPHRNSENTVRDSKDTKSKDGRIKEESGSSLHPSWEAKRKLKTREMKIAPFQGTKIKFDE